MTLVKSRAYSIICFCRISILVVKFISFYNDAFTLFSVA